VKFRITSDVRVELHCYRLYSILLTCGEHDDVQWVSLDGVRSIDVTPPDVSTIEVTIVLFLSFCQHLYCSLFIFLSTVVSGDFSFVMSGQNSRSKFFLLICLTW
jgi:hypothetical protein